MPLLTLTTSADPPAETRTTVSNALAAAYADAMETTTGHVAVAVDRVEREDVWLGRAVPGDLCFLEADVRRGRSHERRRAFAVDAMETLHERFDVPTPNLKVVFTQHEGAEMMGYERVGSEWSGGGE